MSDIIIILLLILLNGVFAMSEIAIISARKHVLEKKSKGGHKGAAGASMNMPMDEAVSAVIAELPMI